jgi:hypothetical protein
MFVSDELARAVILDRQGKGHRLGDRWASSPTVLIWIRHFG